MSDTITIALDHYLAIHQQMRIDSRRAVAAIESATVSDRSDRLRPFARWAKGFGRELHLHHTIEDQFIFPALLARAADVGAVLDTMERDHEVVDEILLRWTPAARRLADPSAPFDAARADMLALAVQLRDVLAPHLDVEDERIVPRIPEVFTDADYRELQDRINRSLPKSGLSFALPWNVEAMPVDKRATLVAEVPLVLRLLYRLNVGRFRRLVAATFDGVPADVTV